MQTQNNHHSLHLNLQGSVNIHNNPYFVEFNSKTKKRGPIQRLGWLRNQKPWLWKEPDLFWPRRKQKISHHTCFASLFPSKPIQSGEAIEVVNFAIFRNQHSITTSLSLYRIFQKLVKAKEVQILSN